MPLLRGCFKGQSVLAEEPSAIERLDSGSEPVTPEHVYRFTRDLASLAQGVTGVAFVDGSCLPIVAEEYFVAGRMATAGVRSINRPSTAAAAPGRRRYFVFGVPGALGFQFAVSLSQVLEVTRALPMASLGFEHSHLAGVAVWRGETIPVIDLAFAAKLGRIASNTPWNRMMIVRNVTNRVFALATTGQVRQPSPTAHVYAPDSISVRPMRGIRGIFRFEGSPLLVPDLDGLAE